MSRSLHQASSADADRRKFEAIYSRTYRSTLAYVLRRTTDPVDADDVVAETFLVAWRRLDELVTTREPQAWLYAVASRVLANHRRGQRRRTSLIEKAERASGQQGSPVDPSWSVEKRLEIEQVTTAMSTLSDRDQEILRLAAFEEVDHAGIGTALGINKPLARSILYRARKRLNKALDQGEARQDGQSGHNKNIEQSESGHGGEAPS